MWVPLGSVSERVSEKLSSEEEGAGCQIYRHPQPKKKGEGRDALIEGGPIRVYPCKQRGN
jgi:hypothetical protein